MISQLAKPAEESLMGDLLIQQVKDRSIIKRWLPIGVGSGPYPRTYFDLEADYKAILRKHYRDTFRKAAFSLAKQVGIAVDPVTLNEAADNWAWDTAEDIVPGIVDTLKGKLDGIAAELDPSSVPGAREIAFGYEVRQILTTSRADIISGTETTRAASAGERWLADRFNRHAVNPIVPVWQTSKDEKVCYICTPLDNTLPTHLEVYGVPAGEKIEGTITGWDVVYGAPPAHPNCRCALLWVPLNLLKPRKMASLKPRKPGPPSQPKMAKLKPRKK